METTKSVSWPLEEIETIVTNRLEQFVRRKPGKHFSEMDRDDVVAHIIKQLDLEFELLPSKSQYFSIHMIGRRTGNPRIVDIYKKRKAAAMLTMELGDLETHLNNVLGGTPGFVELKWFGGKCPSMVRAANLVRDCYIEALRRLFDEAGRKSLSQKTPPHVETTSSRAS